MTCPTPGLLHSVNPTTCFVQALSPNCIYSEEPASKHREGPADAPAQRPNWPARPRLEQTSWCLFPATWERHWGGGLLQRPHVVEALGPPGLQLKRLALQADALVCCGGCSQAQKGQGQCEGVFQHILYSLPAVRAGGCVFALCTFSASAACEQGSCSRSHFSTKAFITCTIRTKLTFVQKHLSSDFTKHISLLGK